MVKLLLFLLLTPAIAFCQKKISSGNIDPAKIEGKILDLVIALPEVVQKDEYVRKKSGGTRHLSDFILRRPNKDFKYYWVYVGEDNGSSFANYFHFYVEPKKMEIKYYDTVTDKAINLKTWREKDE